MSARDLLKKAAGAGAATLAACSPQAAQLTSPPTSRAAHGPEQTDEASTTSEAQTTSEATTTVVIAQTSTTLVLPEYEGPPSDDDWWTAQPGYDGSMPSGACGGALPPCWVMQRESGGDPTAVNATGCGGRGCFGKWQFDPRTSAGLGYALTMDQYPESVQDDAARTLYDGGRGCSAWGAC